MSVHNEGHEPTDLANVIDAYGKALCEVIKGVDDKQTHKLSSTVVKALLARDELSSMLRAKYSKDQPPSAEDLERVAALDRQLKSHAFSIVSVVGRERVADWREAVNPAEGAWWWSLENHALRPKSYGDLILTSLSWILIAVLLSFIFEIVRRFISGGTDLPTTVVQGLLALFAGGTIFQWARQMVEGGQQQSAGRKRLLSGHKARFIAVGILFVVAAGLELARPRVALMYNNWGESLHDKGQLTEAIQKYQRAINLNNSSAAAHYNLGDAYEGTHDYERAMAEYKSAIQADHTHYSSYNNLARLYIVQRGDYLNALNLIDKALRLQAEGDQQALEYIKYTHYKNRGWANLGLKHYLQAKEDLQQALQLNGEGVEAYCLLAQVFEVEKNESGAKANWESCKDLGEKHKNETESFWLGQAREKLK